jgi:hemolysin activation/secretion protein
MNNLSQAPKRSETGVALELDGFFYPKAWDVESSFGAVQGWLGGYWGAEPWLVLAARVGGRANIGTYPWYEAAFIGGSDNVRGYRSERFAGDQSFFGTVEARVPLGTVNIIFPLRFGIYGFADLGRVWVEGESSKKWHPGFGGGIFLRDMLIGMSVDGSITGGDEGPRFYVGFNFTF